jgi:hypothetical protein
LFDGVGKKGAALHITLQNNHARSRELIANTAAHTKAQPAYCPETLATKTVALIVATHIMATSSAMYAA